MKKKLDLRVIRTQKSIKQAFFKLLKEKDCDKITIQDIADEAMINRNTFYLHYQDKQDFIKKYSVECLEKLDLSIQLEIEKLDNMTKHRFYKVIESMCKTIEEDLEFYQIMLGNYGKTNFQRKMKDILKKHFAVGINNKQLLSTIEKELSIEYMISGIIGVICLWIDTQQYDISDIAKILCEVYFSNVSSILGV